MSLRFFFAMFIVSQIVGLVWFWAASRKKRRAPPFEVIDRPSDDYPEA